MSSLVVVSIPCQAERAEVVCLAAGTHPYGARHVFDEQLHRVSLVLDLPHLDQHADRVCERERATAWLTHCHAERVSLPYATWLLAMGLRP